MDQEIRGTSCREVKFNLIIEKKNTHTYLFNNRLKRHII